MVMVSASHIPVSLKSTEYKDSSLILSYLMKRIFSKVTQAIAKKRVINIYTCDNKARKLTVGQQVYGLLLKKKYLFLLSSSVYS